MRPDWEVVAVCVVGIATGFVGLARASGSQSEAIANASRCLLCGTLGGFMAGRNVVCGVVAATMVILEGYRYASSGP